MKKTLLATATLLALTACGSKTVYVTAEPATTAEAPTTQPATTQAPATQPPQPVATPGSTSDFIEVFISLTGPLLVPEQDLIDTAISTCDFLRNGGTAYDIADAIATNPDPDFISALVAAAITVLCPDQQYKIDQAADSLGV